MADIRARLAVLPVSRQHRPADLAPARPHAVGRARADRAQDLRRGPDTLRGLAEAAAQQLAAVQGLVDLQVEKQVRIPQLAVVVDYERAALYGVTPATVTEALETPVERPRGLADRRRQPPLRRRAAPVGRGPLAPRGLANLLIDTPAGPRAARA